MSREEDLFPFAEQFRQLDKDGTGMITIEELQHFLESKKETYTSEEIKAVIREIDYMGNGKINYSEFLSATYDLRLDLTE